VCRLFVPISFTDDFKRQSQQKKPSDILYGPKFRCSEIFIKKFVTMNKNVWGLILLLAKTFNMLFSNIFNRTKTGRRKAKNPTKEREE
jgi:hypothetical protein